MIVGIDEVGRGAWAGPLVVGAVVLGEASIEGLTDSKKLTAKKRQVIAGDIKEQAHAIGLGWVSAETIDRIGLSKALTLATTRAVGEILIPYDRIIIDGTVNFLHDPRVVTMKQADLLVPSVSAASIIAKVARDYYMREIVHAELPEYGFNAHVGYGTAKHAENITHHGPSYMHRMSFKPVLHALGLPIHRKASKVLADTTGAKAERVAAQWLSGQGYKIIEKNWRTKVCEIDIIVVKNNTVYFVEVKYRKTNSSGDGLDAITPKKLQQMSFAARVWQQYHPHSNYNGFQLAAVSLEGETFHIKEFLKLM